MLNFFDQLQFRNEPLFLFGSINMAGAIIFLLLSQFSNIRAAGANAWFKPFKLALSIGVFSWAMGWYAYELHAPGPVGFYNWIVIVCLGFEIIYISIQAGRGQLSHSVLFVLMGLGAAIPTLWTGYVGLLFFNTHLDNLPGYYVWSIRLGIVLFVIFSFKGALMGSRLSHSVGGPETGARGCPSSIGAPDMAICGLLILSGCMRCRYCRFYPGMSSKIRLR